MQPPPDQYDTPWKEAIERYFPEFMAFYFPSACAQIDWQCGYAFLDQELQAITLDAEIGKRFVDKLVRVTRLSGQDDWIYIHLEVQGTVQTEFAKRMFVYNYRIFDKYERPVASMAVLADEHAHWKPQEFGYEVLDCQMGIRFPVAKLQDYSAREQALAEDPNPFALVTLAHLQTQSTRKDPQARFDAKWKLVQLLYRRGWDRQRILDLLFVLDWMMSLPDHLSKALRDNIHALEQEEKLKYVSTFERLATEEGLQKGLQQGMQQGMQQGKLEGKLEGEVIFLERQLTKRFGPLSNETRARLRTATESQLEQWADRILDAPTLAAVFELH